MTQQRSPIEGALKKIPNRFNLTLVASYRARQLAHGMEPLVEPGRNKPAVIALREIEAGKIGIKLLEKVAKE